MELPRKPILCIDFDGVIHGYQSGWKGADVIPDPPVPGAIEALLGYLEHFTVCIHSSRFNLFQDGRPHDRMIVMADWLRKHGFPKDIPVYGDEGNEPLHEDGINLCSTKPSALLTIDDRGWTFDGTFPTVEQIRAFRPWNKRGV
jgi:hypothetical protein